MKIYNQLILLLTPYDLIDPLGYDFFKGMDDTSTTTISPSMFEEFCMDYTDRVTDISHKYSAFYAHHSCGLIRNLLRLYRKTRMNIVDALNLEPLGGRFFIFPGERRTGA